jgi:hypothetical protein
MVDSIGRSFVAAEKNDRENWFISEKNLVRGVLANLYRKKPESPERSSCDSFETICSDDEEEYNERHSSSSELVEAMVNTSIFANQAETPDASEAASTTSNKQPMTRKAPAPSFK